MDGPSRNQIGPALKQIITVIMRIMATMPTMAAATYQKTPAESFVDVIIEQPTRLRRTDMTARCEL